MNPLVSVIIPTYGRPESLIKCIESVLNQSYQNIEIIVVDDNDPKNKFREDTELLMERYQSSKNIQYIKHEKNKNASAARNTGIKFSTGELLCFLDDDDEFRVDKVKEQVEFLESSTYDACYCAFEKNGKEIFPGYEGQLSKELLLLEYHPVTSTIMFTRHSIKFLNGFDASFNRHQDYEIMLRFFKMFRIGFLGKVLLDSGKNDGSNIPKGDKLDDLKNQFFNGFMDIIEEIDSSENGFKDRVLSSHYSRVFLNHLHYKKYRNALNTFKIHFTRDPYGFLKEIIQYTKIYLLHL